jgi:hypothetical protein
MAALLGPLVGGYVGKVRQAHQQEQQKQLKEYDTDMRTYQLALDNAAKMNLWDDVGNITNLMNERTEELPGAKHAMKQGQLGDIGAIGGKLSQAMKQRQQQQKQQAQQQAALKAYGALPGNQPLGVTPGPNPDGTQTTRLQVPGAAPAPAAPQTPGALPQMPPLRQRSQELFKRLGPELQQAQEAQAGREFETKRKQGDVESEDAWRRKGAAVASLVKGGMKPEEAEQIVYGKQAAPGKATIREVAGVSGDAYGHPGKTGTLSQQFQPDGTIKEDWRETTPKPAGQGRIFVSIQGGHKILKDATGKTLADLGAQDEPITWREMDIGNQKYYVPYNTRNHAAAGPAQTELPQGEKAESGGKTGAPKGINSPMPPASTPVARAAPGGQAPGGTGTPAIQRPPGVPKGARYAGEKFTGADKQLMERAETVMRRGVSVEGDINRLQQQHPDWFGALARLDFKGREAFGASRPELADLLAKVHSVQNFLPSMHGLRGKYPIESWEAVLQDPLKNPQATAAAIHGALDAVQEYRRSIQKGDFESDISVDQLENQTPGAGAGSPSTGPSPAALDYMKKHGLQ